MRHARAGRTSPGRRARTEWPHTVDMSEIYPSRSVRVRVHGRHTYRVTRSGFLAKLDNLFTAPPPTNTATAPSPARRAADQRSPTRWHPRDRAPPFRRRGTQSVVFSGGGTDRRSQLTDSICSQTLYVGNLPTGDPNFSPPRGGTGPPLFLREPSRKYTCV